MASWSGLLVVAGRVVPGWGMGCALLCIALGLLMRMHSTSRRSAADAGARQPPRVPRWMLFLSTAAAALAIVFGAGDDLLNGADYFVLEPEGPGGCRVAVRETSFLVMGGGEVFEVGAGGLGRRVGSWTVDDGYRPFRSGTYELDWGRDSGSLRVDGTGTDPVTRSDIPEINCG
ncbi:hypothetical protein [Streptomyces sp. NPDC058632]|uniref:hypothetical protein n=1 Tax=Streptomyces sp. NPDC058632 TaxID=3346567 RepID=UPI00365BA28D